MLDKSIIIEQRARAHHLKPVVIIGSNGLSEGVIREIDIALEAHELIKVKAQGTDKITKTTMIETIVERTDSHLIQVIGNILIFYRKNKKQA